MAAFEITDSALNDFCRFFGLELGEAAKSELEAEFRQARFVKRRSGAEIWRGRRPRRIQFIVFPQTDGRMVVGSVSAPFRSVMENGQARVVTVMDDVGTSIFTALDTILERGPQRRIAYHVLSGTKTFWLNGHRGAKLDQIVGTLVRTEEPPDWARPFLKNAAKKENDETTLDSDG